MVKERRIVKMKLVVDKIYNSIQEASEFEGVPTSSISNRIKNKWVVDNSLFIHHEPELDGEVWKLHPTLPVELSNLGRIKYDHGKIGRLSGKRYLKTCVKEKYYMIHRLVAQTFLDNPHNYPCVNHIDHNKQNNCVDNLEWCTSKQNAEAYKKFKNKNNTYTPPFCNP